MRRLKAKGARWLRELLPLLVLVYVGFVLSEWWWRHIILPGLTYPWVTEMVVKLCQGAALAVGLLGALAVYAVVRPLLDRMPLASDLTYREPGLVPQIAAPTWQDALERLESGIAFTAPLLRQNAQVSHGHVVRLRRCRDDLTMLLREVEGQPALPQPSEEAMYERPQLKAV